MCGHISINRFCETCLNIVLSRFIAPRDKLNEALDEFTDTVEKFPKQSPQNNARQNLTRLEWEAVKCLKEDNSIIIKEADKGGASVIMNKEDYKSMVETILNDEAYESE